MSLNDAMKAALQAAGKAQFGPDFTDEHTLFTLGTRKVSDVSQQITAKVVVDDDATWKEIMTMMTITHPNLTEIRDVCKFVFEGCKYFAVIEEPVQNTLAKEVTLRQEANQPFTEIEVISHGKALIDALACLQSRGIAHCSIHPDNIFVAERKGEKVLKLGNFWWSLLDQHNQETSLSLADVSQFSSPLILAAHQRRERSVRHNPFKSDVYSLGRVLQFMTEGWSFEFRSKALGEKLGAIVQEMTVTDEKLRPSFVELSLKYPRRISSMQTEAEMPEAHATTVTLSRSACEVLDLKDSLELYRCKRQAIRPSRSFQKDERLLQSGMPESRPCKCTLF